jgi:hypothetical protein
MGEGQTIGLSLAEIEDALALMVAIPHAANADARCPCIRFSTHSA